MKLYGRVHGTTAPSLALYQFGGAVIALTISGAAVAIGSVSLPPVCPKMSNDYTPPQGQAPSGVTVNVPNPGDSVYVGVQAPAGVNAVQYELRSDAPPPWEYYNGWHQSTVQNPLRYFEAHPYKVKAYRFWFAGNGNQGLVPLRVEWTLPGETPNVATGLIDARTPGQIADAPKVNFDPHDGYLIMSPVLGPSLMQIMGSGRVTDPNGPLNHSGLELQYDENGVRKSRPIELNPDGTFKFRFKDLIGDGVNGRPLIFYRRTNGDNVNVGYYGTAQQLEKRKELKEFRYDNLRHKISEAVKASGHFRYIRTNGVTMGVRG